MEAVVADSKQKYEQFKLIRHCSQVLAVETGETDVMWKHGDNLTIIHISRSWQQQLGAGEGGGSHLVDISTVCRVERVCSVRRHVVKTGSLQNQCQWLRWRRLLCDVLISAAGLISMHFTNQSKQ